MNIVFFIGNGFDVNLGLATRYLEFEEFYKNQKSPHKEITKLKESIDLNEDKWSDLEVALGEYTINLKSEKEFDIVYEDLEDSLATYLTKEESKITNKKFNTDNLYSDFTFPETHLPTADKKKIQAFRNRFSLPHNINIITFNYTKTIENIIGGKQKTTPQKHNLNIEHIHGYINNRMVLGVNDVSQIANEKFRTNKNIIEYLVKSRCNQAQKHTLDEICKERVRTASLICIFGSSIGETDKLWWELIGERLKEGYYLIIFAIGKEVPLRRLQKRERIARKIKDDFLNKTNLKKDEKLNVYDNIFVGYNTSIFDIKEEENMSLIV